MSSAHVKVCQGWDLINGAHCIQLHAEQYCLWVEICTCDVRPKGLYEAVNSAHIFNCGIGLWSQLLQWGHE